MPDQPPADVDPDEHTAADQVRDEPASFEVERSAEEFTGKVVSVRTDHVRMPGGDTAQRDVVVHPGAVGVIAVDDDGRVLFVRQYRHPVQRKLWEPPAGLLDDEADGETAVETARRELWEESGYRARDWRVLVDVYTSPGMTDEALRIFLARDLTRVPAAERHAGRHEEADMPTAWVPLDDAVAKVLGGDLHNPTAVAGVLAAAAARGRPGGFDALRPADSAWPERAR